MQAKQGIWVVAAVALLTTVTAMGAQNYPAKSIRLVIPFATGGGTDIVARGLAQKLTDALGQPVLVDNRGGGGGSIGIEIVVRAVPDGYTLSLVSGSYAANAALFKLSYDPVKDILPIALIGETAFLISLHPGVAAKSVTELIALAKSKPGALNYGSTGIGGITHLATELFDLMAGTRMTHVPFTGTGPALNGLLGGHIQLIFGSAPSLIPQVRANRLRAIAVTTRSRAPALPDVPTVTEAGVPGYEVVLWYGVWGPRGLSRDIVARWNSEIRKVTKLPDMKERLAGEGLDIADGPPELFQNVVKRDVEKWTKVVKQANVKAIE